MKTTLFVLLGLAPLCAAEVMPLDGDWDFTYQPQRWQRGEPAPLSLPADRAFVAKMPVPGYWDDHLEPLKATRFWSSARFNPRYRKIEFPLGDAPPDAELLFLQGLGWYRKVFRAPAAWDGRLVTLHVGGVREEAWVWLNGNLAGHYLGVSTPFELQLEKWIRPGSDNTLVIAVSNAREDRGGCALRGYQGRSGGIYRPVWLKVAGPARIASVYLRGLRDNQAVSWNVELETKEGAGTLEIGWRVRETGTGRVLGSGKAPARGDGASWETPALGMRPWSDHDPNLYQIDLTLYAGGREADEWTQGFGLRTLTRNGAGLRLNGRPTMLRGGTDHYYYPLTTTAPAGVESYRGRIRVLKSLGFNWIRFHTWTPSEEHMQAADELGMMLQVEAPEGFDEREWTDIVRTGRKHPSVVIYCPGNEEMLDEPMIARLGKLAGIVHQLAPDAMFSPNEALRGVEYLMNAQDSFGPDPAREPFPHSPSRLAALREFSDVFASYANGQLSYNSVGGNWRKVDAEMAVYGRPILSHELGIIGNYMNLDLEHRFVGTRIGTDLFAAVRQNLARAGLLQNAALYYRNSCAWTSLLRKHNLEMARRARYIAGYDFLGAFDQNWHRTGYPCGIMNEFYEMKPGESVADVLKYNGESVLLLDYTNARNFTAGDRFRMDLMASLYGEAPLEEGRVRWYMADSRGALLARGTQAVKNVRNGTVVNLGAIDFQIPAIAAPSKVTLVAQLSGGEYEVGNDWNFWVFPKFAPVAIEAGADAAILTRYGGSYPGLHPPRDGETTRLVSVLDAGTLAFLEGGGKVLLLGPGPFPSLPTSFQMSTTGRAMGNLATVIADHPLMRRFPHDGYCDWQFYAMMEGRSRRSAQAAGPPAAAVDFSGLDLPFSPILEVVSSFKTVRKQASLFEFQMGPGRLLVSTLNLDVADPAGQWMLDSMIRYMQSDEFRPRTRAGGNGLRALLQRN